MAESGPIVLMLGECWPGDAPGGLRRYFADLGAELGQRGVRPLGVVLGPAFDAPVGVASAGRYDDPLLRRVSAFLGRAWLTGRHADMVDAHFALYALLPLLFSPLRHLPLVVHFQGPWADESAVGAGQSRAAVAVKRWVEGAVYRRADAVVVLSEAFGKIAVSYGVDASRVHVVPPGVDLVRFRPGDRVRLRRAMDVGEDEFLAVAVRRLDARMGLGVLIDAWGLVQRKHPKARLVIAGEGTEHDHLDRARRQLPNPDGVRLVGRLGDDDLVALYQAADCSVVPTVALEGFGLVTLESAACGTPPIVTDVGGLPDGIRGLDPSLIVAAGDPAALAKRLVAAAEGGLPSREACRTHAERFSWNSVGTRHLDLYRQVVGSDRRIRITYLDHTAALSGGELALARLLPALFGVDAHVELAEEGPLVERLQRGGASVEVQTFTESARGLKRSQVTARLPLASLAGSARYTLGLARRLRRLRPDLVHANSLKALLYGGVAGRLAGVPVVWHLRDRIADDYLPRPAVILVRAAARVLPAGIVANSESTLATLRLDRALPTAVIPSPVEPFDQGSERSLPDVLRVGMVGRFAPWKGQLLFVDAFARAFPDGNEQAVLVGSAMFGEDVYVEEVENRIEQLGLADRIELRGFRENVAAEYARLDIVVLTSTIPEPFGQVVVEAMAAGLPVVVPDAGGPAEVVTDGVDGVHYPMGDAGVLADRMRSLANDPDRRARMGKAAQKRAHDFGAEAAAERMMAFYREVLADRRRKSLGGHLSASTARVNRWLGGAASPNAH